jgi:hypothetical protein
MSQPLPFSSVFPANLASPKIFALLSKAKERAGNFVLCLPAGRRRYGAADYTDS